MPNSDKDSQKADDEKNKLRNKANQAIFTAFKAFLRTPYGMAFVAFVFFFCCLSTVVIYTASTLTPGKAIEAAFSGCIGLGGEVDIEKCVNDEINNLEENTINRIKEGTPNNAPQGEEDVENVGD